jgi:subtilisin-like proprotein convertase family protein
VIGIKPPTLQAIALATVLGAGVAFVPSEARASVGAATTPDGTPLEHVLIHLHGDTESTIALRKASGDADTARLEAVQRIIAGAVDDLADLVASRDLSIDRRLRLQPTLAAEVTAEGLAILERHPRVRAIEPDRRWRLQTAEGLPLIGADILHQLDIAGDGTAVAIIDSGVDYHHPTLGGGQIPNAKVVYGLDTADGDSDPIDCNGHGTAVASVAAGSSYQWSPGRRFAGGVAPSAKILAYKVTQDTDCQVATTAAVIAAIEDAVLRRDGDGYRLAAINISLGGGASSEPCDSTYFAYAQALEAAAEAGVAVVAAAGNSGRGDALSVPACVSTAIAVGSAWDEDPGALPFRFCLDPECLESCDDSFQYQRSVSCYSNSSPQLDLIAPSEHLKAAAAGSITADFGGTSGAAAYVTGAIALLAEALGDSDPTSLRLLLAATGVPTMDDKNGLIRPMVHLGDAMDEAERVAISTDRALPISPASDTPTISVVRVDRDAPVGHLEVLVDLAHPSPEDLRLSLQAPDGTTVTLHDGGAGHHGITGTYPHDLRPIDSLGRFAGVQSQGDWVLTIETDLAGAAPDTEPKLVGWALKIEEPTEPPFDDTTMVFPVVAHAEGANDTQWRSDLRIFNHLPTPESEIRLVLLPPAGDTSFTPRETKVIVPHGSVVALDDVVERRFGLDSAQGSLVVRDAAGTATHATSRTYTLGENGTYGQFVAPVVGTLDSTGVGDSSIIVLPTTGADQRVNIGVTEITGASATVAITVIDSETGIAVGPSTFLQLPGFSNIQLNGVLPDLEFGAAANPYIAVNVVQGAGRVTAYGSVIDNRSGDAVFVAGSAPRVTPFLLVPVVARNQGEAGTEWRSDLRLLNHGNFSIHVDAELRLQGAFGLPALVRSFELQPGQATTIEDVVGSIYGFESAVGSLRLVPREGPAALCATSRTANHGGDLGTYGQYVPALAYGDGLLDRGVLLHIDSDDDTRTNIGLVETNGLGVSIGVRLLDDRGLEIGAPIQVTLGPWDSTQINQVFEALSAAPRRNARVEITRVGGNGAFFAYASVIDAHSGDAIFVPIQEISTP